MPTIKLHLTDKQYKAMQEHFSKGSSIETQEETTHGFGLNVSGFSGLWFLEVESQAGKLDLEDINVEFDG
jgi:hypothetical protein